MACGGVRPGGGGSAGGTRLLEASLAGLADCGELREGLTPMPHQPSAICLLRCSPGHGFHHTTLLELCEPPLCFSFVHYNLIVYIVQIVSSQRCTLVVVCCHFAAATLHLPLCLVCNDTPAAGGRQPGRAQKKEIGMKNQDG